METQCSVAEPDENGGMSIVSSTQTLDGVQSAAARALGIPFHAVTACKPCRHHRCSLSSCAPPCLPVLAAVLLKMIGMATCDTSFNLFWWFPSQVGCLPLPVWQHTARGFEHILATACAWLSNAPLLPGGAPPSAVHMRCKCVGSTGGRASCQCLSIFTRSACWDCSWCSLGKAPRLQLCWLLSWR